MSLVRRLTKRFSTRRVKLPDEIREAFVAEDFGVTSAYRHGYPHQPSCFAFDQCYRLLAIGTKDGFVTLYGRPGVEQRFEHPHNNGVTQIIFIPNTRKMLTVCGADKGVYLWNLVDDTGHVYPMLENVLHMTVHSNTERLTVAYLPPHSAWLYIGTRQGNIYMMEISSLKHSNYVIYWSNANAGLPDAKRNHPGEVVAISEPPSEPSRLIICYSEGLMIIWNLKQKTTEKIFDNDTGITSLHWGIDKHFTIAHSDGSMSEWAHDKKAKKSANRSISVMTPYGRDSCMHISKVLKAKRMCDTHPLVIFSGGLPADLYLDKNTVTIMNGADFTTLEFNTKIIDFVVVETPPHKKDETFATALLILCDEEFIAIDLLDSKFPEFKLPYLSAIHSSPVSAVKYYPHCPGTFLELLRKTEVPGNFSSNLWPITGGKLDIDGEPKMTDIVVTGHEDGAINIWIVSASMLRLVYTLQTEHMLEAPVKDDLDFEDELIKLRMCGAFNPYLDDPNSKICLMEMCPLSRILCVANRKGEVFKLVFNSAPRNIDTPICNVDLSPPKEPGKPENAKTNSGVLSFPPGLQPELCIKIFPPCAISTMSLNPSAGLLGLGNMYGLAVFDIQTHKEIMAQCTLDKTDPLNSIPYSNMTRGEKLMRSFSVRASRRSQINRGQSVRRTQSENTPRGKRSSSKRTTNTSSFGADNSARKSRLGSKRANGMNKGGDPGVGTEEHHKRRARVRCLVFADTFCPGSDTGPSRMLWCGQGNGKIQCFNLKVPEGRERMLTGIEIKPEKGLSLHHDDPIVFMGFVDKFGKLLPDPFEIPHDETRLKPHYAVVVSRVQIKVISLPDSITVKKDKLSGNCEYDKAFIMTYNDAAALVCLQHSGHVNIYSLPSLKTLAKNARCLAKDDISGQLSFSMARNGYAVYLFKPSELQWITVAETFLPPDMWTIDQADPIYRKKIKFDRTKLFEKHKTQPRSQSLNGEDVDWTRERNPDLPPKARNPSEISSNPASPELPSDAPDLLSPDGSMCEIDNVSENLSETGSRGRRRRSSVAEALHDVISAGRDMLRSSSKNSIEENKSDGLDNGAVNAIEGAMKGKYSGIYTNI